LAVVKKSANAGEGQISGAPSQEIRMGPFTVDVSSRRLLRNGSELDLRPRTFDVLLLLIRNSGRCVSYDEMIRAGWGGVSVARHTVAVTVAELKTALGEFGDWIRCRSKVGYALEVPESADLIRLGWHFWSLHTREGFEKALECFQRAQQDGAEARAWEGMAACYIMLSTFGLRPPQESYAAFLDAHSRVVALTGLTPELRAERARGLHLIERRFAEAECELRQALAERPGLAIGYTHLMLVYGTSGRLDEAVKTLEQGYRADALSLSLRTTEVLIRLWRREFHEAVLCGKKAVELYPGAPLCRSVHAQALEYSGKFDEALTELKLARMMAPDIPLLQSLGGRYLAKTGKREEARAILHDLQRLRQSEYVDPYAIALLQHALGNVEDAFHELDAAFHEGSPTTFLFEGEPEAGHVRATARLSQLRAS